MLKAISILLVVAVCVAQAAANCDEIEQSQGVNVKQANRAADLHDIIRKSVEANENAYEAAVKTLEQAKRAVEEARRALEVSKLAEKDSKAGWHSVVDELDRLQEESETQKCGLAEALFPRPIDEDFLSDEDFSGKVEHFDSPKMLPFEIVESPNLNDRPVRVRKVTEPLTARVLSVHDGSLPDGVKAEIVEQDLLGKGKDAEALPLANTDDNQRKKAPMVLPFKTVKSPNLADHENLADRLEESGDGRDFRKESGMHTAKIVQLDDGLMDDMKAEIVEVPTYNHVESLPLSYSSGWDLDDEVGEDDIHVIPAGKNRGTFRGVGSTDKNGRKVMEMSGPHEFTVEEMPQVKEYNVEEMPHWHKDKEDKGA